MATEPRAPVTASPRPGSVLADPRLRWALFLAGAAISLLMVVRTQVGGDQLDLLARGWRLAARGDLVPHGNPLSNGGNEPGAVTSLIVGLPLFLRMDHIAPVWLVWITHLLAWWLLDRTLRSGLGGGGGGQRFGPHGERARTLFAVLYWLSPWQLYFAGLLWNPSYLFLAGAVHLATAWAQRERARFGASFAHALALGIAAQLHPSAMILVFASAFLLWRRYWRVHWGGFLLGGALASLTLIPWLVAVRADPTLLPGGKGFPFRGLILVQPMLRGIGYWLRYPTFLVTAKMERPDFTGAFGVAADAVLAPAANVLRELAGWLLLPVVLAVTVGVWRRRFGLLRRPLAAAANGRTWLFGYALWTAVAALLSFAASPTTVMGWQGLIALHAAVLPVVLGLDAWLRTRRGRRFVWLVPTYAAWSVLLLLGMALSSPHYRCGGRLNINLALLGDHAMFHDLRISERCPFPIEPVTGWWPDALSKPGTPDAAVTSLPLR